MPEQEGNLDHATSDPRVCRRYDDDDDDDNDEAQIGFQGHRPIGLSCL